MMSPAAKKLRQQIDQELKNIRAANAWLRKTLADPAVQKVVNAGQIIEARAKEIITEKGHIDTGNLRR